MSTKQYTVKQHIFSGWSDRIHFPVTAKFAPFSPIRKWLENIEIKDPEFARQLCTKIPSQCPFERKVNIFGRTILTIPPLCKLNPFYNEVVGLRFRAICYLADKCGEDVSAYC